MIFNSFPMRQIAIWAADPLDKIFPDTLPPGKAAKEIVVDAARGEVVSAQVALRWKRDTAPNVAVNGCGLDSVVIPPPRLAGGRRQNAAITVEPRWVGLAHVQTPAGGVCEERLDGKAPGFYPDPLYPVHATQTHPHHFNPDHSAALCPDRTRALWLTIRVPRHATPGVYRTTVEFTVAYWRDVIRLPLQLTIHAAQLPAKPTCGVENWLALASIPRQHECAWWSARFWELVEAYLLNLVDHRQTHLVIPMFELIEFLPAGRDGLRLDWTRFDRFVKLALKIGIQTLVGNHLATYTYKGRRPSECGVHTFRNARGIVQYSLHEGRTAPAQRWLAWFLPQLRSHLKQRGWLNRWWQHIRDEPGAAIRKDYEAIRRAVKNLAPEFRTIDALHGPIVDACDCWVPGLDAWGRDLDFFRKRQAAGDTVWTYVCCGPTGLYANRFIDQKSLLPRLIFWIMARFGASGYLHWGYNWSEAMVPETDTTWFLPVQGPTQSGDVCVVYPGPHGPRDSIRWELQREGLQDYELLRLLRQRDPALAERIMAAMVCDFTTYCVATPTFRAARRALLEALSRVHPGRAIRVPPPMRLPKAKQSPVFKGA